MQVLSPHGEGEQRIASPSGKRIALGGGSLGGGFVNDSFQHSPSRGTDGGSGMFGSGLFAMRVVRPTCAQARDKCIILCQCDSNVDVRTCHGFSARVSRRFSARVSRTLNTQHTYTCFPNPN